MKKLVVGAMFANRHIVGRRPRLVAALLLLPFTGTAWAQGTTPEGIVRAASVQAAILQFCGPYHPLDGPKALQIGKAFNDMAYSVFPKGKAKPAIDREFKRRFQEVKITGPQMWCRYQRETQKSIGSGVFLD
ncbi:hypothetical protein IPV08_16055 [Methylobacterium sp. SD274]|uniref:hypothetical protein n=1 Tax=Methylobacterium sp. SD274 TaxID=2782009 RepID=UPI001A96604E|nr:hypothetical protein [Methylobacterium sp. SD274]MBO1021475.1 hypothetical protein [Methylobacterium sp. SD274]